MMSEGSPTSKPSNNNNNNNSTTCPSPNANSNTAAEIKNTPAIGEEEAKKDPEESSQVPHHHGEDNESAPSQSQLLSVAAKKSANADKGNKSHPNTNKSPTKRSAATSTSQAASSSEKPQQQRTNWAIGDAKRQLEQAVAEWDNQEGRAVRPGSMNQLCSMREFADRVGIPYHTFRKYVTSDSGKRRKIGESTGRKALISPDDQAWIAQKLAESGEGLLSSDAVDCILERRPDLTRQQALRHFNRTLLKHQEAHLKTPQKQKRGGYASTLRRRGSPGNSRNKSAHSNNNTTFASPQQKRPTHELNVQDDSEDAELLADDNLPEGWTNEQRQQALSNVNAKIQQLRSQLLDAELEKEKILRGLSSSSFHQD